TRQGVVIEDNCWLGYGVKVLDGVTIGEGSVIGAGAVVTKDIPPYSVAVGVPAKVVRSRQPVEKQFTNWREASY
ncbi:MAG: acyltransferase, partial [Tatlockia sp.]|nr:acyltransferase [Tatlockia sp.]